MFDTDDQKSKAIDLLQMNFDASRDLFTKPKFYTLNAILETSTQHEKKSKVCKQTIQWKITQ